MWRRQVRQVPENEVAGKIRNAEKNEEQDLKSSNKSWQKAKKQLINIAAENLCYSCLCIWMYKE